jgi:hypothetical protein
MISNTLGAFAVGLVAVVLAKWKKCPVTLFSVPGMVPLVPGAPAYMVVRRLIDGKYIAAQQMMMRGGYRDCVDRFGLLAVNPVPGSLEQVHQAAQAAGEVEKVALQGLGKSV